MGFWRDFLLGSPAQSGVQSAGIASPFTDSQLQSVVWSEVFGTPLSIMTRADALTVPAVFKATSLLKSLIADKPLRAYRGDDLATEQPTFLYRTDGGVSPWLRMASTLDDLVFYGYSLWLVERGAAGQITSAVRCPWERWKLDAAGRILVQQAPNAEPSPIDSEQVILIPGPSEGLLTLGSRTLRGALAIEGSWVARAQNPIPQIELHQTEDSGITAAEAKQLVSDWNAARASGATAFTPFNVQANALGQVSPDLFTEGRNNNRLDIAQFFNLPASLLDASLSTASLTYSTQEGGRNDLLDYSLPYWLRPIEGRLSQDDIVPASQRVAFDLASLITIPQDPNGALTDD